MLTSGQFDALVRWLIYGIATSNAVVFPTAQFSRLLPHRVVLDIAIVTGSALLLLFLRALFDPQVHRAINAANREMQGGQMFKLRGLKLLDPNWGLFGSRMGSGYLPVIRVVAFVEFVLALITVGGVGTNQLPTPLLIAASTFGLMILLTMIQLNSQDPATAPD